MDIKIFNIANIDDYKAFLKQRKIELDIYYDADFLTLDAGLIHGEFEIYTIAEGSSVFVYPYIKRPLENPYGKYFDITSPYGYCGPYCSDGPFLNKAEVSFIKYALENSIVTEFVRYHFLYNADLKFSENIKNEKNRVILTIDLNEDWENIWMKEMSVTNRNIVRKLEKEGFLFTIEAQHDDMDTFIRMYNMTMKNAGADDFYYFPDYFYHQLFKKLNGKIFLAKVFKDGEIFSSSLFIKSGSFFTYYLSARNVKWPQIPASNLILTNAIKFAKEQNCKWFNLGGGRTNSTQDALFKFKSNFCRQHVDFYIGKRIHNKEVYDNIVSDWIARYGLEDFNKRNHMLQFYRN